MHLNKKEKTILIAIIVVIIGFPFLITWIYSWNCRQIIPVDIEDILSYYATAFAIPGSFAVLYITRKYELEDQKRKEEKEIENNMPHLTMSLKKKEPYFQLTIYGCGKGKYNDIYFFEKSICDIWMEEKNIYRLFFYDDAKKKKKKKDNIVLLPESFCDCTFDENGYPETFQIQCGDVRSNVIYLNCFKKYEDDGEIKYALTSVEKEYV